MRNAINSVPLFLYISLSGILLTRFLSSGIRFQESKISFHTLTTTDEACVPAIGKTASRGGYFQFWKPAPYRQEYRPIGSISCFRYGEVGVYEEIPEHRPCEQRRRNMGSSHTGKVESSCVNPPLSGTGFYHSRFCAGYCIHGAGRPNDGDVPLSRNQWRRHDKTRVRKKEFPEN